MTALPLAFPPWFLGKMPMSAEVKNTNSFLKQTLRSTASEVLHDRYIGQQGLEAATGGAA